MHLLLALLFASPAHADTLWAGVPLAELAALGLGEADLHLEASGWRAPIPAQGAEGVGFVLCNIHPDLDAARADFAFQGGGASAGAASSMAQPPLALAPGVDAVGDLAEFLVFRDQNMVCVVRDRAGRAAERAAALRAALVVDGASEPADWRALDGDGQRVLWDGFGRRRVE